MSNETAHTIGDLPNKPLVEAIFELRWAIDPAENGLQRDPGWSLLPGLYFAKMKEEYPFNNKLSAADLPEELASYTVRHQFRKAKDAWPLVQIGPGILTLNDTTGYTTWGDFRPRVEKAIQTLTEVYQGELRPIRAELWFINAIPYDVQKWTPSSFLRERLHISTTINADLKDGNSDPSALNLNFTIPLTSPSGNGLLAFATGVIGGEQCIVWHLKVTTESIGLPELKDNGALVNWLDSAHSVIDQWFVQLAEGELLQQFKGATK